MLLLAAPTPELRAHLRAHPAAQSLPDRHPVHNAAAHLTHAHAALPAHAAAVVPIAHAVPQEVAIAVPLLQCPEAQR